MAPWSLVPFLSLSTALTSGCTGELRAGAGSDDSDGGSGSGQAKAPGEGSGSLDAVGSPGPAVLPRLTVAQYRATLRGLYGDNISIPDLESDNRPDFFSVIGSARQPITETAVALFWDAGKSVAKQVSEDATLRAAILPCPAAPSVDESCLDAFFEHHAAQLLRRPLSPEELSRYSALFTKTSEGNLWQGLNYTLAALLSSPAFLYRHDKGQGSEPGNFVVYDDHALASRLSFLVTNEPPDSELLAKAAAGQLRDPEILSAELDRLYQRALDHGLHTFFDEYLDLEAAGILDFENASPVEDQVIGEAMREEAMRLAIAASESGTDFRSIFTTQETWMSGPLAELYGVPGIEGDAFVPYRYPDDAVRAGLLTTGAILTADAAQERTKPSNRGLYVQFRLRCLSIPDPPDDIPPLDSLGDPSATSVRAILDQHRADPVCAACHDAMDPIGFAMEDFDQFGGFRTNYPDGSLVDASSEIDGVTFSGAKALGVVLGQDEQVTRCITKQIYRYANARVETRAEEPYLDEIHQAFKDSGFQFIELLRATVRSEGFLSALLEEAK